MNHLRLPCFMLAVALVTCASARAASQRVTDESQTGDPKLDYKLRASRAEADYGEICDNADEIVHLADDIAKQLGNGTSHSDPPPKTFDRLRKLARKVRSQLGGSGDPQMENPPALQTDAATALLERGRALTEELHRSTRYEVNARVIVLAGEIVYLVDLLRHLRGID